MTSEKLKEYEAAMMIGAPKNLPKLAAPKKTMSKTFKIPLPSDHDKLFKEWFKANPGVVNERLVYNYDARVYGVLKKH